MILHANIGYIIILVVVCRIIWGFIGTRHARFADFIFSPSEICSYLKSLIKGNPKYYLGHNPAGGLMILIMLTTILLVALSGLNAYGEKGFAPLASFSFALTTVSHADDDDHYDDYKHYRGESSHNHKKIGKNKLWKEVHESSANFLILLIIIHICGVVTSSFIHRENLILSIITGRKKTVNLSSHGIE